MTPYRRPPPRPSHGMTEGRLFGCLLWGLILGGIAALLWF